MIRTLLVEDSAFFRQILRETLLSRFPKMDIAEAPDAKEALKKIKARPPDIIFMDIKLPGENGLELTKKIKEEYPSIVVIMLTSYDTPEYREAASHSNANYFFSKGSFTRMGILTLINSILSEKEEDSKPS